MKLRPFLRLVDKLFIIREKRLIEAHSIEARVCYKKDELLNIATKLK